MKKKKMLLERGLYFLCYCFFFYSQSFRYFVQLLSLLLIYMFIFTQFCADWTEIYAKFHSVTVLLTKSH